VTALTLLMRRRSRRPSWCAPPIDHRTERCGARRCNLGFRHDAGGCGNPVVAGADAGGRFATPINWSIRRWMCRPGRGCLAICSYSWPRR
jgi:hypothetical protein